MKVKDVADSVGEDASVDTSGGVRPRTLPISGLRQQMVKGKVAHIDACARPGDALKRLSGILKGLVHHLEHLSLGRVHGFHLATRDAEEAVVKEPGILLEQKGAPRRQRSGPVRVVVQQRLYREVGRTKLLPTFAVVSEELP